VESYGRTDRASRSETRVDGWRGAGAGERASARAANRGTSREVSGWRRQGGKRKGRGVEGVFCKKCDSES